MEFCGIHGRFDSKCFAHLENEAIFTILGGFYMFKLPALAQAFYLKKWLIIETFDPSVKFYVRFTKFRVSNSWAEY